MSRPSDCSAHPDNLRFFVLAHGSVRVFYSDPTGRQIVVKLFQAPVAFGEMECITGVRRGARDSQTRLVS